MHDTRLVIVSPALHDANNGNWQTARRWQKLLTPNYRARIVRDWPDEHAGAHDLVMLALHARRSASSIAAWTQAHRVYANAPGLAVVLTGTDLYRDILHDTAAQASLQMARILVTLQERGPHALPRGLQSKARVIFQSTPQRQTIQKTKRLLRVVVVGHLREEKAPESVFALARALRDHSDICIDHIGVAIDPALGRLARQTAYQCPAYRWLGAQSHETVRRRMQRAHLLLHPSRMEGGAHVVMEALRAGTAVLASRVDGNVGMLGDDYGGYFEVGDVAAAAGLVLRCRSAQVGVGTDLMGQLMVQCQRRALLFDPALERARLHQLVEELLARR